MLYKPHGINKYTHKQKTCKYRDLVQVSIEGEWGKRLYVPPAALIRRNISSLVSNLCTEVECQPVEHWWKWAYWPWVQGNEILMELYLELYLTGLRCVAPFPLQRWAFTTAGGCVTYNGHNGTVPHHFEVGVAVSFLPHFVMQELFKALFVQAFSLFASLIHEAEISGGFVLLSVRLD